MGSKEFPVIELDAVKETRDALHAWSRVLGAWLKSSRPKRKHWWHASLRPSLTGLTTGVVRADTDFEIDLDFSRSECRVSTLEHDAAETLTGQSAASIAAWIDDTLQGSGIDPTLAPSNGVRGDESYAGYSAAHAARLHRALASITTELELLRAGIREETSPIQVWPHHFDLSMIWLPGHKISGQDPADEEYSDKQMNFGFVFGDVGITEPYLYVTAYPVPEGLPQIELPTGATWKSEGFSGVVLLYQDLVASADPSAYLQDLWSRLLAAGQTYLASDD